MYHSYFFRSNKAEEVSDTCMHYSPPCDVHPFRQAPASGPALCVWPSAMCTLPCPTHLPHHALVVLSLTPDPARDKAAAFEAVLSPRPDGCRSKLSLLLAKAVLSPTPDPAREKAAAFEVVLSPRPDSFRISLPALGEVLLSPRAEGCRSRPSPLLALDVLPPTLESNRTTVTVSHFLCVAVAST